MRAPNAEGEMVLELAWEFGEKTDVVDDMNGSGEEDATLAGL